MSEPAASGNGASRTSPDWVPVVIYHIFRILLGLIFVVAGLDKIGRPADFVRAILAYQFLEGPFAYLISPMAIVIPWLELACGFFLIINRFVRPSSVIILGLNVMFIIAIGSVMARGISVECGCGLDIGPIASIAGTQADAEALVRDFVIVAMNLVVMFSRRSAKR
jgi:uncharacterized membrane protein YphA (DoxX/SURF4 family)